MIGTKTKRILIDLNFSIFLHLLSFSFFIFMLCCHSRKLEQMMILLQTMYPLLVFINSSSHLPHPSFTQTRDVTFDVVHFIVFGSENRNFEFNLSINHLMVK